MEGTFATHETATPHAPQQFGAPSPQAHTQEQRQFSYSESCVFTIEESRGVEACVSETLETFESPPSPEESLEAPVRAMQEAHRAYKAACTEPHSDTPLGGAIYEAQVGSTLKKLVEARTQVTRTVRAATSVFDDLDIAPFVATWNAEHGGALAGAELTLARREQNSLAYVDGEGRLALCRVELENALALLEEIKAIDRKLDGGGNSHELRKEILKLSEGQVTTAEGLTYGTPDPLLPAAAYGYYERTDSWVPERALLQKEILDELLIALRELAKRLDPGLYALRGNTGTGKSYGVRNHAMFKGAVNPRTNEIDGAANPDISKYRLQIADRDQQGKPLFSSGQVHDEGSAIHQRILNRVVKEHLPAVIVDQRHLRLDDIKHRQNRSTFSASGR